MNMDFLVIIYFEGVKCFNLLANNLLSNRIKFIFNGLCVIDEFKIFEQMIQ